MTRASISPVVLSDVVILSREIWEPILDIKWKAVHLETWHWTVSFQERRAAVLYLTIPNSPKPTDPVGYCFIVPKRQPEIDKKLLHIEPIAMLTVAQERGGIALIIDEIAKHA